MTVRELVAKLLKANQDAEVWAIADDGVEHYDPTEGDGTIVYLMHTEEGVVIRAEQPDGESEGEI